MSVMNSESMWDDWLDGSSGAMAVSAELAKLLAARIEAFPVEALEFHQDQAPFVANFGALPLYYGWTTTIAIRPDGQMIQWSTDGQFEGIQPVDDRISVLLALNSGSKRYPELQALLPIREPWAVDCACREHPVFASGNIGCGKCGGIGWLPGPVQVPAKRTILQKLLDAWKRSALGIAKP
jgi:hypothetical protein